MTGAEYRDRGRRPGRDRGVLSGDVRSSSPGSGPTVPLASSIACTDAREGFSAASTLRRRRSSDGGDLMSRPRCQTASQVVRARRAVVARSRRFSATRVDIVDTRKPARSKSLPRDGFRVNGPDTVETAKDSGFGQARSSRRCATVLALVRVSSPRAVKDSRGVERTR
jgi:hypothetical protein